MFNIVNAANNVMKNRIQKKENMKKFLSKKRDIFLMQMKIDQKKEQIQFYESKICTKKKNLQKFEHQIIIDKQKFDHLFVF